jgi:hypothetical protein
MPNPVPARCYLAKKGSVPWSQSALPLWDDDVDSLHVISHLMDKAAERNVSPRLSLYFQRSRVRARVSRSVTLAAIIG